MHPGNIKTLLTKNAVLEEVITTKPFISVITVSLNAASFIEHNLKSVVAQTYTNKEHIVIDGESTDGTVDIIKRYGSHLSYWHSRKDRGISDAFNLGLAQARGEWFLFLNADDFLLDTTVLEAMAEHLQTWKDADVVFGRRYFMTRDVEPRTVRQPQGQAWSWKEFRRRQTIPHPAAFMNRRYFDRVGEFDVIFQIAMDYEIFLRGGQNLKAQFVPLPITGMRDGGRCRQSVIRTWKESLRAQEKNSALPPTLARLNCFWQIGRVYLALFYRNILRLRH